MPKITPITHNTETLELKKAYRAIADNRMLCYNAHIEAGFDHDSAIEFTLMDTQIPEDDEDE